MRPAMLDYQVSLAQVYLTTGKIEKFRGLAEKLSHIYSNSPTAAAAMGIAETISQNYGKALQWLQKSEALSSNSQPWLFAELAKAYLRLEQWSKAQLMFEKAIAADDQIAEAYAGLSKVQLQRKENQAAAASARRAAELQPADPEIQYQLGLALLATDEYLEARRALECAVEAKPASIEMIKALAQASEKLGDSPHAKALYHRIFTLESRRRIIPGSAYDSVSHNLG
jgi:tetratricopeptide (TPR) repeat protein